MSNNTNQLLITLNAYNKGGKSRTSNLHTRLLNAINRELNKNRRNIQSVNIGVQTTTNGNGGGGNGGGGAKRNNVNLTTVNGIIKAYTNNKISYENAKKGLVNIKPKPGIAGMYFRPLTKQLAERVNQANLMLEEIKKTKNLKNRSNIIQKYLSNASALFSNHKINNTTRNLTKLKNNLGKLNNGNNKSNAIAELNRLIGQSQVMNAGKRANNISTRNKIIENYLSTISNNNQKRTNRNRILKGLSSSNNVKKQINQFKNNNNTAQRELNAAMKRANIERTIQEYLRNIPNNKKANRNAALRNLTNLNKVQQQIQLFRNQNQKN